MNKGEIYKKFRENLWKRKNWILLYLLISTKENSIVFIKINTVSAQRCAAVNSKRDWLKPAEWSKYFLKVFWITQNKIYLSELVPVLLLLSYISSTIFLTSLFYHFFLNLCNQYTYLSLNNKWNWQQK